MKVKSKLEALCKLKSDSIHPQDYTYTWYSASVKEGALFKVSFKMNAWVECVTLIIYTQKNLAKPYYFMKLIHDWI